jgi:hypothetical protein
MRYISRLSTGDRLVKKRDWMEIQHKQADGIRRAVVYVSELGCEGQSELFTAIQIYA